MAPYFRRGRTAPGPAALAAQQACRASNLTIAASAPKVQGPTIVEPSIDGAFLEKSETHNLQNFVDGTDSARAC